MASVYAKIDVSLDDLLKVLGLPQFQFCTAYFSDGTCGGNTDAVAGGTPTKTEVGPIMEDGRLFIRFTAAGRDGVIWQSNLAYFSARSIDLTDGSIRMVSPNDSYVELVPARFWEDYSKRFDRADKIGRSKKAR